jgi:hypothetical protein
MVAPPSFWSGDVVTHTVHKETAQGNVTLRRNLIPVRERNESAEFEQRNVRCVGQAFLG